MCTEADLLFFDTQILPGGTAVASAVAIRATLVHERATDGPVVNDTKEENTGKQPQCAYMYYDLESLG